ncbi:MYO18 [Mytilus coruscus]|uniref:MYO18 n=1 Tax=Mytilus coruscus TaxID=42192 RepID=A0A6J8EEJ9_MYTCO|nr:MYO18 [Mytilus coruscus]
MYTITSFIYWFLVGFLYIGIGIPYAILKLSFYCLQIGFSNECSVVCRFVSFILIELAINLLLKLMNAVFRICEKGHKITKGHTFEEEQSRLMENSKISQTSPQWKLKYEMDDKEYSDLKKQLKLIFTRQKKRRHDIISKFKRKRDSLKTELESKTKLFSGVKCKATALALDTENMILQIRIGHAKLQRLKEENMKRMERYTELAEKIQWDYRQSSLADQERSFFEFSNDTYD